jgi:hypothetical protein
MLMILVSGHGQVRASASPMPDVAPVIQTMVSDWSAMWPPGRGVAERRRTGETSRFIAIWRWCNR